MQAQLQDRTLRLVAVSDDTTLTDSLARLIDGGSNTAAEVLPGDTLPEQLPEWQADLVIMDVANDPSPIDTIHRTVDCTDSRVVALGAVNDVSLYRAALQAGADDYLLAPVEDAVLQDVIDRARQPKTVTAAMEEEVPSTALNLIIGARGGVGATTVAVSTAWLAAETFGRETALVDLDLHYGSCALALDLLPGSGLRDALRYPERIDSLFIGSAMINATEKLFVLGAEESLDQPIDPSPEAINILYEAILPTFDTIIVDLPRSALAHSHALLERADSVTVVTDTSIAGLRDTARLQDMLRDHFEVRNLQTVVVERPKPQQQVTRKELEQGLGDSVHAWIPHDAKAVVSAAAQGKAVAETAGPKNPVTKSLHVLAKDFCGIVDEKKAKKLWRW